MARVYQIPINRGHAQSAGYNYDPITFGKGFIKMSNVIYDNAGNIRPPYAFSNFGSTRPDGSNVPRALFQGGGGVYLAIFCVTSSGGLKYSLDDGDTWASANWLGDDGGGGRSAPTLPAGRYSVTGVGVDKLYFTDEGANTPTYKISWTAEPPTGTAQFDELCEGAQTDDVKGRCVLNAADENRLIIGGHADENNGFAQIRFSDVLIEDGDDESGFGSDMGANIGGSYEGIRKLVNFRGGLTVFKDHSVFRKYRTDPDRISSTVFRCIIDGLRLIIDVYQSEGNVFVLTFKGLALFTGESMQYISLPLHQGWHSEMTQERSDNWHVGYWSHRDWVVVSDTENEKIYYYDLVNNRWMTDSGYAHSFVTTDYEGKCIFLDNTGHPKVINAMAAKSIAGEIWTPFDDCGNPGVLKQLRKVYTDAQNVATIKVYGREGPGGDVTEIHSGSTITDGVINIDSDGKNYREFSVKITSDTNGLYMSYVKLQYDERRL